MTRRTLIFGVCVVLAFLAGFGWSPLMASVNGPHFGRIEAVQQVIANDEGDEYLVVIAYDSGMSFGSGNHVLRLHSRGGAVIDQVIFGSQAVHVARWNGNTIALAVPNFSTSGDYDRANMKMQFDRARKLGRYVLAYDLRPARP